MEVTSENMSIMSMKSTYQCDYTLCKNLMDKMVYNFEKGTG